MAAQYPQRPLPAGSGSERDFSMPLNGRKLHAKHYMALHAGILFVPRLVRPGQT